MRLPEPSVTPTRSVPIAAPSRSGVVRGSAFDDMMLAASGPVERRESVGRDERSVRSEGLDADRSARPRSGPRPGGPATLGISGRPDSRTRRAEVAADESAGDVDGQVEAGSAEAAVTGSPSTAEAATADRAPTTSDGAVEALSSPGMIGQSAPTPGLAPVEPADGTGTVGPDSSAETVARQPSEAATVEMSAAATSAPSSTEPGEDHSAVPGTLADPVAKKAMGPRSGADGSAASSGSPSDVDAGTAASVPALPVSATAPTAAVTAPARAGVATGAASMVEGPRAMGELTVRVADARPTPPSDASSASPEAAVPAASSSSPSAPGSPAAPAPLLGGSVAVQQTDAAAPALPGRPIQGAHPSLSTQIGTELLSLRQAADGDHIVTVAVRPDNLGPVTISAVVGRDGMSVELFSPSSEGRDALKQMLPDLRRDLASTGGPGSSLDLGARDAPQERPRHREFNGGGHVAEPRFRAPVPVALHPSSARLDVLV